MKTRFTEEEIKQAACLDMDNQDFFLDELDRLNRNKIKALKQVCNNCTIRFQCLEIAMNNEEYGIWGGTTERERWRMKRRANRPVKEVSQKLIQSGIESNKRRSLEAAHEWAKYLQNLDKEIIQNLPQDVKTLIRLRIENPSISISELGALMNPPLNKDQVSGKLRRALGKING